MVERQEVEDLLYKATSPDFITLHVCCDTLAALCRAWLSVEDAWQPIETAPKDGTAILIYAPKFYFGAGVYVAWWGGNWWEVCTEGATDYPYSDSSATHWMPLPDPPKEARNG